MQLIATKVYDGNQTVIPAYLRKKYNIQPDDIVEWYEEDGEIRVQFRKKVKLEDVIGSVTLKEKTDAVKLKKMAQRGEKYKGD